MVGQTVFDVAVDFRFFVLQKSFVSFFFQANGSRSKSNSFDMASLLLTALPHDCLVSIAALVPTRSWQHLRATCRDLRAAVRDATNGLVIDLCNLPFFPTPPSTSSSSSSPHLPTDRVLLSRVSEVRLLLHKDRDDGVLTAEGLGRAEDCPVEPLLREIERARSAADEDAARRRFQPLRVSLCVRAPRSYILTCVPRWLRDSGIAELVTGTVDVRADGVLRPGGGSSSISSPSPASSSSSSWGGFPPECRFRVETKLTVALEASSELLRELAGTRRVASLSVLSLAAGLPASWGATYWDLETFRALAGTLEELRLGESVPASFVCRMLLQESLFDVEPGLCWPALRRMALLGSPDFDDFDADPRNWAGFRSASAVELLDLFPSLETLAVKSEHAQGWLRRFGDAIDPARVAVERL